MLPLSFAVCAMLGICECLPSEMSGVSRALRGKPKPWDLMGLGSDPNQATYKLCDLG